MHKVRQRDQFQISFCFLKKILYDVKESGLQLSFDVFRQPSTWHIIKTNFVKLQSIPDFGVSTAILNTTDISRRWCKLNFGILQSHIKSLHSSEKINAKRQYFFFFIQISWNNWQGTTWTILLNNDFALLLPCKRNEIRLRLG